MFDVNIWGGGGGGGFFPPMWVTLTLIEGHYLLQFWTDQSEVWLGIEVLQLRYFDTISKWDFQTKGDSLYFTDSVLKI